MKLREDSVVRELRDELGEDLRSVFWGNFPERGYSKAISPPAEDVDPSLIVEVVDYLVEEQFPIQNPDVPMNDDLTSTLRAFQLSVRVFTNRLLCLAWNAEKSTGLFVSTTADADLSFVSQTMIAGLNNQLSERIEN